MNTLNTPGDLADLYCIMETVTSKNVTSVTLPLHAKSIIETASDYSEDDGGSTLWYALVTWSDSNTVTLSNYRYTLQATWGQEYDYYQLLAAAQASMKATPTCDHSCSIHPPHHEHP